MSNAIFAFAKHFTTFLLLIQTTLVSIVKADCYAYDGVFARDSKVYTGPELITCGNNTNNCCLRGEKCGTNLLCATPGGGVTRQYCADINWRGCSMMCVDTNFEAGIDLTDCGRNIYCCGKNNGCCTAGRVFYIDPNNGAMRVASYAEASVATAASPTWWAMDSTRILAGSVTSSISSTATGTSFTMTAATTEGSASISGSVSGSGSGSALVSTSTSTATSTATAAPSSSSKGISAGAGAGIGIGGAVVIAAILFGLYVLRKRRNARKMQPAGELQTHAEQPYPYTYQPTSYPADVYMEKIPAETSQHGPPTELAAGYNRHELK